MSREFNSERDVPLILLLLGGAAIGAWGVTVVVDYLPVAPFYRYIAYAAMGATVVIAPLTFFFCYERGKTGIAWVVTAITALVSVGVLGAVQYNGQYDDRPMVRHETTVEAKLQQTAKGARVMILEVQRWDGDGTTNFSVPLRLWGAKEPGDTVWVWSRPGALGIEWKVQVTDVGAEAPGR